MAKALVICGATASGKTDLAVSCAEKLQTEIISADSMLVYRGLSIGTAKPTEEEMRGIKHHLIDVADPKSNFSVSDYEKKALPVVKNLFAQGKTPIICGGTGFYINALLYKSGFGNTSGNCAIREKYEKFAEKNGVLALHGKLKEVDPESAQILHPNDVKRVIRALEIYETTGKKKSEQKDEKIPEFDFVAVCIDYPREELYRRINLRVDKMFERGLKKEVETLLQNGVTTDCQCMQGIGYKEIAFGIQNGLTDEQMKEEIKKNTRNYAKRQITFFKRTENLVFLPPEKATSEEVLKLL